MGKTKNQEMIQQLMDEGEYAPSYPFVLKSKLSALEKLLVGQMLNDIRMNGTITWKHQTYADKLGSSRQVIMKLFGKLNQLGILIGNENNKQGGKSNTFEVSFNAIEDYETCNKKTQVKHETSRPQPETSDSKPETSSSKPETSRFKPETSRPKPDTESIHIKKLKEISKETNKENNKESINTGDDDIIGDNVSFYGNNKIKNSNQEHLESRTKELVTTNLDLTDFLDNLDI
tara:strand:+ start:801 stop:1496 length:696 start_codon:yes stop_codon:yes gene_type:complete